jgi:tRNA1Val (adenine37-N6)-methyltransferase
MGRNKWFEFKQFRIEQQNAAMKVGTDGVILGAWAPVENASRILDVGTGTGLIALMLAQRCNAKIDAVEIDAPAYLEAKFNFNQSQWKDRLRIFHSDFNTFSIENGQPYDLIVCNPPFFIDSLKTSDPQQSVARHNESLNFEQLILGSAKQLKETGKLVVIIPFPSLDEFRETARLQGFYLHQKLCIVTKPGKIASRVLLELSLTPGYTETSEILIQNNQGQFTDRFKELTGSFYLNF